MIDAGDTHQLDALFRPRSIALVGATDRSMWSVNAFRNLREYSPEVEVHCINPSSAVVHGVPAHRSLSDLPAPVDLAFVMSPRETVVDILAEGADLGTRNAIVLTAGFGETADGRVHEQALRELAARERLNILGPNGSGYVDVGRSLMPFGLALPPLPDPGPASFVLQSGGLVKPILSLTRSWGIGVGMVAGMGNEAVLTAADAARHLLESPDTGAVGLFLEAFRDIEAFRELAQRAIELDRPLVVLPVGRSEVARRTAQSHTGALAGDAAVTSAALRDLGVVEVQTLEELVATTGLLSRGIRPRGGRIAVVSASGGSCEVVADKAADLGLALPDFSPETAAAVEALVPGFSHAHNPLDVTGYATVDPTLPVRAAEAITDTGATAYDVLLFQAFVTPGEAPTDPDRVRAHFASIAAVVERLHIPLLLQDEVAVGISDFARGLFSDLGLVRLPGIDVGVGAVGHAIRYAARRAELLTHLPPDQAPRPEPLPAAGLGEVEALTALRRHGVPVVPHTVVQTADDAVRAATEIGDSIVLKVSSPDLAHKSDVGGVALDLRGDDRVRQAYKTMLAEVTSRAPDAEVTGVVVAAFRRGGVELLVGLHRDPAWGPVLVLGMGGVLVEVLADVAIRPLPVSRQDITAMLGELRGFPLLAGVRGRAAADLNAVADAVLGVTRAAQAWGVQWESIDVNPLVVDGDRVEALDALVIARPTTSPSTPTQED